MGLTISAAVERWPVNGQFIISRGAKDHVDVLLVAVSDGSFLGLGEGTAIYYHGESAESCLAEVMNAVADLEELEVAEARALAQHLLGPGAARNALDCALWDLEAKQRGLSLWQLVGMTHPPRSLETAFTISLGEPEVMEVAAEKAADKGYTLLKLKLTGEGDRNRVAAVRKGAPDARLIVDANESWGQLDIYAETEALADLGVEMIEQPVPVGSDALLDGLHAPLPFLADESCQSADDIKRIGPFYDGVNIKLDKAGGLTEALKLADAAEEAGLKIMVGCMLSTSLGIGPAFIVAQRAQWVDLDGPVLLAEDREDGFRFENGRINSR